MVDKILQISLCLLLLLSAEQVLAKQDKQYLLTEKTYKILAVSQQLMVEEKYSEAEKKLSVLFKQTKSGSYDQAVVLQTMGYLYSSQEQYDKAIKPFEQALNSGALPEKVADDLRYNLAQLLLAVEKYQQGIELLETWLISEPSPPSSARVLIASAYYQLKNYKQVIKHISIAIEGDKSAKEAWYQLLLFAHLELKQYKSAISVLETLITRYPHQEMYWTQLAALYMQQDKEFRAVATRGLAHKLDLTDSKILISLADMYRYLHIPYKSAQLLNKAIDHGTIEANFDNLEKLADSWIAAKEAEKAAAVLERVALLDNSGESDLKRGRVLMGLEQWKNAVIPLTISLDKLKDEQLGTASLLLGMAQFHLGDFEQADIYFSRAITFKQERNQAEQWLRYLERIQKEIDNAA